MHKLLLHVIDYTAPVVGGFRALTRGDARITELATATLTTLRAEVQRKLERAPTVKDNVQYLSRSLEEGFRRDGGNVVSMWSGVQAANERIAGNMFMGYGYTLESREWHIELKGSGSDVVIKVEGVHHGLLSSILRVARRSTYLKAIFTKPEQGKVWEVISRHAESNYFNASRRYMWFADRQFVHLARLNLLPLNRAKKRNTRNRDRRFRRCGHALKSLPHILNHCRWYSAAWKRLHVVILERLAAAVSRGV